MCVALVTLFVSLAAPPGTDASHKVAHCQPLPGDRAFPPDFPVLQDKEWHYRLGGWGGIAKGHPLHHRPVIFVHGNTRDAHDWDEPRNSVKQRFLETGYSMQELWALSYNGTSTKSSAPAVQCRTDNTSNLPDLVSFVQAVLPYTGAQQVDIVAHSLGVTLVRSMLKSEETLMRSVRRFVAIAGPNHGTTVCRRAWLLWIIGWQEFTSCDEIAPGSSWLNGLNRSHGAQETPGSVDVLTIYDGTGADVLYQRWLLGWPVSDQDSPALKGAQNTRLPGLTHDALRTAPEAVSAYLDYLLSPSP